MRILALEPYYGGSHKAFIKAWQKRSYHDWTMLTLPPYKWKWRMRHSAVTFAEQAEKLSADGLKWDIIFSSDMLNLAEFSGLATQEVSALPSIAYFHENQLTYPVRFESERDYQFVMTNMTTALAADAVWFNSAFHRDSFLDALAKFLKRMPDNLPLQAIEKIRAKSEIYPQGIEPIKPVLKPENSINEHGNPALRILWAARWEHDKNPEDFFEAMKILKKRNIKFKISVMGQQFRDVPEVFGWAKKYFADEIENWGYQANKADYEAVLKNSDVVVSTANHEFFGISIVEAVRAGAYPVLPNRLSYPEILELVDDDSRKKFFYDGTVNELANRLEELALRFQNGVLWGRDCQTAVRIVTRFDWDNLAAVLDRAVEKTAEI